ncbi:MAG: ATP synthase F1 subunit delta [Myxococcota bacterium]
MIGAGALARRYARALVMIGEERGDVEGVLTELNALVDIGLEHAELWRVLFTPLHPRAERRAVIRELAERLGLSRELRAFGMLLVDENRTAQMPDIREALRILVERAAGRVEGRLSSARPLADEQVARLREVLSRRVGAEVRLEVEIDPELIGGVVARVGDLLIDGSVRTQVDSLAQSLRRGSA